MTFFNDQVVFRLLFWGIAFITLPFVLPRYTRKYTSGKELTERRLKARYRGCEIKHLELIAESNLPLLDRPKFFSTFCFVAEIKFSGKAEFERVLVWENAYRRMQVRRNFEYL